MLDQDTIVYFIKPTNFQSEGLLFENHTYLFNDHISESIFLPLDSFQGERQLVFNLEFTTDQDITDNGRYLHVFFQDL